MRRVAWVLGAAVAMVSIGGFWVLPPIAKRQAQSRLSELLGRPVSIASVRLNPFMLSATVEDFAVGEKDSAETFLGWHRLYVRFDALRSAFGAWVVGDVELDGLRVAVTLKPGGSFNFSDILARLAAGPAPASGPSRPGRAVLVGYLEVKDAQIRFDDRSLRRPFSTLVGPLSFTLSGFRTVGGIGAPYSFEASTDSGERLSWSGTLAADPVASKGQFKVEGLALGRYAPYFEDRVLADVKDGRLSASGSYEVNLDPARRAIALRGAVLRVAGLRVGERSTGAEVLSLPSFDVSGIDADAVAMRVAAAKVTIAGGRLSARREPDGAVNLLSLLPAGQPAAPAPSTPASLRELRVGEIAVSDFAVAIEDRTGPRAAQLGLQELSLSLHDVSLVDGASMPIHLAFDWIPKGRVSVDGTIGLKPSPRADLRLSVASLAVLPVSPLLEGSVNARITQGSLSASGRVAASLAPAGPEVSYEGDFGIDGLGIVDSVHDGELAGVDHFSVAGIKASSGRGLGLSIERVDVAHPYARLAIAKDGTMNLATLEKKGASGPPAAQAPATTAERPLAVAVRSVHVSGGELTFTDRSLEPNVRVGLGSFGGTVSGLSSDGAARADVEMSGSVDGGGAVSIKGTLDPLGAHRLVDLKIDIRHMDLVPTSPYAGKFAGYQLARGQLNVDTRIRLDGDALDASNMVTLEQFAFGDPVRSPDATALPVRLGVALLKDVDGRIVVDLPVQGSLADPSFKVGRVVLRVVVNLLTRAAVSPFSLVGSMFGGGGEELSYQDFAPGSSDLLAAQEPKLVTIAKALSGRPGLSLGIRGDYDPAADAYALKRIRLEERIRRTIWEDRRRADPNLPPPDKLVVTATEHDRMVKRLFDVAFPPGTQFGTPLPQAPAVKEPPARPRPGFLRRVLNLVTLADERQRKAEEREQARLKQEHERQVADAAAKGLPAEEMVGRLAEAVAVTPDDLRLLASARAVRVRSSLADVYHIAAERLFLEQTQDAAKPGQGPRVFLTLQ